MAQMVEALRCKPEGRGFYSRWGHCGRTLALGSTVALTEGSARSFSWGVKTTSA